ncbi:hypothetical protein [Tahibacter sp.]|uniref:hypothetical protein n=1 Tax=Tahibacter sp. TaxID=2056211 RepID=UPI002D7E83B6|nr:hypothetical protein [Tahibacter sp.]
MNADYFWRPEGDRMSLIWQARELGYVVGLDDGGWLAINTLGATSILRCTSSLQAREALLDLVAAQSATLPQRDPALRPADSLQP